MTTIITQFAHGVLVLGSDPTVQLTSPLPSFNPSIDSLPANPLAVVDASDTTETSMTPPGAGTPAPSAEAEKSDGEVEVDKTEPEPEVDTEVNTEAETENKEV